MLNSDAKRRLCVELQSCGISFAGSPHDHAGGAGPSDSRVVVIDGHYLSVPATGLFVAESPYRAQAAGPGKYTLYRYDEALCSLQIPGRPAVYARKTAAGTPYEKVALIHGRDCLASTLYQDCRYCAEGMQCHFCAIGLSLDAGRTVLEKQPRELSEVARYAARNSLATHVTLTSGSRENEKAAAQHIASCVRMIKQHSGLPIHVQICPPESAEVINALHAAGADTVGIHIETFCEGTLKRVAPAKARYGIERYRAAWQQAVELFGTNQVSSFLIAGLGEDPESLVEGARQLAAMGVFPYLLPLRPVPGSRMEHERPPAAQVMLELYNRVAVVLKEYGLSSRAVRAGCVRCGACSCLQLFESEDHE